MIKSYNGKKITPKQYACQILLSNIDSSAYWQEEHHSDLTDSERKKIDAQVSKLAARFEKQLIKISTKGNI